MIKHRLVRGEITTNQANLKGIEELTQTHTRLIKLGHDATGHTAEVGKRQMEALDRAKEAWLGIVKDAAKK